ncbi:MAG: hypothetical protein HDR47_00825 [Bacteroides sp.]|nr:hypothetical protein [Bacteroides sp.]MBD5419759.1 hypothetical protein [Bacteroides sp.]
MRKLSKMIMALAISASMGLIVSCSDFSQPSPDEVVEKIQAGKQLEDVDYETMLDYLEEFVEVGEASPKDYEAGQELAREYPYFLQFANKVVYAPEDIKNGERYNNIMRRYIYLMQQ